MDPSQMETRKSPITRSKSGSIARNQAASIARNQAASEEPNSDDVFVTPRPPRMLRKGCVRRPKPPVQAQQVKKKTYPTVRCAPGSIVSILSTMSRSMKEELIQLGFKDFLGFALDKIDDRALVVFIMDHIEVDPLRIVVNGRVLPITPLAVKHVLGLPDGTRSLDDLSASDKANYLKQLRAECEWRGMKNIVTEKHNANPKLKAFDDLKPNEIPRYVVEEFAKMGSGDDWSIKCFFMTLLDGLLFSTSSLYVPGEVYYYCKNKENFGKYNFCTAVVDDLTQKSRKWKQKLPSERTGSASIQGCVAFLLIYYLDNLHCPDYMLEDAKSTPRASFFTASLVDKIAKADMKVADAEGTITYGNLRFRNKVGTCYEDVRADDLASPDVAPPQGARRKRQRTVATAVGDKPSAANTAPAKPSRPPSKLPRQASKPPQQVSKSPQPSSKPPSAAAHNSDDGASSIHLLPKFMDMISQIQDEKLQGEARLALQDHDSHMDAAMKMVEDGKKLVFEGESSIKNAHREVVAVMRRILGHEFVSRSDRRASSGTVFEETYDQSIFRTPISQPSTHCLHEGAPVFDASGASHQKRRQGAPVFDVSAEPHQGDGEHVGEGEAIPTDGERAAESGAIRTDGERAEESEAIFTHASIPMPGFREETHDQSIFTTPILQPSTHFLQEGAPVFDASGASHHQYRQGAPVFDVSDQPHQGASVFDASVSSHHQRTQGAPVFDASGDSAPQCTQGSPVFDASDDSVQLCTQEEGTQTTHSTAGVDECSFDREGWNEMASFLKKIDDGDGSERTLAEFGASPMKPLYQKTVQKNLEPPKQVFAPTYKRRRLRKNDSEDFLHPPSNLGCELAMFQLTDKATTRSSKVVSTVRFRSSHRCLADIEKAMKLRDVIIASPPIKEMEICCLLKASQDLYYRTSHSCIEQRSTIVGSFLDASICKSSFIDFFGTCLMLDDQSANPIYPSYRIILPIQLSNTILYEQYHTGSPYSHTVALSILSDLFDPDQLLLAKLVIVPVYHSRDLTRGQGHWSLYCVNLVHGQIDILDPFRWTSDQHRDCYHGAISGRIRYRLNALFYDFTNGRFIDFSQFGLPFVQVPKFAYSYDDALYIMLFMEHYDAVARKVDAVIIPEFGTQYKAQILYYMMFHKLNEKKKELPYDISVLAPC